jgi:hypothetical protein
MCIACIFSISSHYSLFTDNLNAWYTNLSTNWFPVTKYKQGPSWSWSYGSWIYTYLMLWVWIRAGEVYSIQHYVIKWLAAGWWFSPGTPVSSTNKSDSHCITEILLKVALSIITLTLNTNNVLPSYTGVKLIVVTAVTTITTWRR